MKELKRTLDVIFEPAFSTPIDDVLSILSEEITNEDVTHVMGADINLVITLLKAGKLNYGQAIKRARLANQKTNPYIRYQNQYLNKHWFKSENTL